MGGGKCFEWELVSRLKFPYCVGFPGSAWVRGVDRILTSSSSSRLEGLWYINVIFIEKRP